MIEFDRQLVEVLKRANVSVIHQLIWYTANLSVLSYFRVYTLLYSNILLFTYLFHSNFFIFVTISISLILSNIISLKN